MAQTTQAQIAKPATKTTGKTHRINRALKAIDAKPAEPTPPAEQPAPAAQETKPAEQPAPAAQETAAVPFTHATKPAPILYVSTQRPGSGHSLYAHTAAFFALSGMRDGGRVSDARAKGIVGERAISHHTKGAAPNLAYDDKGLFIANPGHFYGNPKRPVRPDLYAAWVKVLTEGADAAACETLGIRPASVIKVA